MMRTPALSTTDVIKRTMNNARDARYILGVNLLSGLRVYPPIKSLPPFDQAQSRFGSIATPLGAEAFYYWKITGVYTAGYL